MTLADRHAWIEEGAHLVAPGVHRIPLPLPSDGLRAVNVYAIEASSGLVLIDSGWALANALDQLERSLAAIGAGLADVQRFLVTHMHRDHYTQAVEVRRLFGTPIALGEGEKPSIDGLLSSDFRPLRAQLAILRAAGAARIADSLTELTSGIRHLEDPAAGPGSDPLSPGSPAWRPGTTVGAALGYEAPDEWISGQRTFDIGSRTLTAVETPGHTRGHVVFADAEAGLLFAGDHVLPHITPSIGFQEAPSAEPLREYLQSLTVVRRLPDMRLLPAHGPVSPSAHARIDELTEHHAQRLKIMADVLSGGERTGYEVALSVAWTSRQRELGELDLMNQMLAVCETVYHLDLLAAQGTAISDAGEDGIRRYRLSIPPAVSAPAED
ncbi:MAG TPA: MBL fold metallo-hydrolase [Streptosporangiaceae bacterium]|nr:MBL fold metallo-hydrolase [Streptosporangiaceae bacterium]